MNDTAQGRRDEDGPYWGHPPGFMEYVLERGASLAVDWPVQDSRRWDTSVRSYRDEGPFRRFFEETCLEGPGMWKWRHYFELYNKHLGKFIGKSPVVVEVGVWSGGSLRMWKECFGAGCQIHGVDVDEKCKVYADDSTTIHFGDQADREFWARFRNRVPKVDVFIDDGDHNPELQIITLEEILPHIAPGGVYICEDINHRGHPFVAFVCSMLDRMNGVSMGIYDQLEGPEMTGTPTPFQSEIAGIYFHPFMVVIEKRQTPLTTFSSPKHGTEWQPMYWMKYRERATDGDTVGAQR